MRSRRSDGRLISAVPSQLISLWPMKMNDPLSIGFHSLSHWPLLARWPLSRGRFLGLDPATRTVYTLLGTCDVCLSQSAVVAWDPYSADFLNA